MDLLFILALAVYTVFVALCFYYKGYYKGYNKAMKSMNEINSLLARIMFPGKEGWK